jgi:alkylation response protein AidB-like acyl-CoA dehydrogenase
MATTAIPKTKISGGSFLLEERQTADVFTPEDFSEQHRMIGQTAEEFSVNEILPQAEKIEHKDYSVSRDLLKKAGDLGLSGVEVPEAYGGLEMDKVTAAIIADHIAKYAGFATTWGAHSGIGMLPIVYFGTEEQKKNICRAWPQEKRLALTPCRKRLPVPTRSIAVPEPCFRPMAKTTS